MTDSHVPYFRPGDMLADRYRIVAWGGQTALYVAYHGQDYGGPETLRDAAKRSVLIKLIRPQLLAGHPKGVMRDLLRLQQLRHPHLPQAIDCCPLDSIGTVALVEAATADYGPRSLMRAIFRGRQEEFTIFDLLPAVEQIGDALTYIHRQKMHHGDVRPETIALLPGLALLCDAGLAHALGGIARQRILADSGEDDFWAPEVRAGHPPTVVADVFGLSAVVKHALAGRQPHRWQALMQQWPALATVLTRATLPDPAQRYRSVASFVRDLRAAIHPHAAALQPPPAAATAMEPDRLSMEQVATRSQPTETSRSASAAASHAPLHGTPSIQTRDELAASEVDSSVPITQALRPTLPSRPDATLRLRVPPVAAAWLTNRRLAGSALLLATAAAALSWATVRILRPASSVSTLSSGASRDAPASTRAFRPSLPAVDVVRPTSADAAPRNRAVLFATWQYDDPRWRPLQTPRPDADSIGQDLRQLYGFQTTIVSNPTVAELRSQIRALATESYDPRDQLLLMFSGHGDRDDVLRKGWIIARDTQSDGRQGAYPFSELREDVDNIPCRHILLVLDVCFGGSFDPSIRDSQLRGPEYVEASASEFVQRKLRYASRLYLSSVDQQTQAPDGRGHSPFAWRFLEALRSGGGPDGVLTWSELTQHLERLNPEPRGGVFPGTQHSDPGGDFLFVLPAVARRGP